MPRLPVRNVSLSELQQLFNRMQLWRQINDGSLTSDVVASVPANNPRYAGGTSQMLLHRNADGRHVCTTHRIIASDGKVLHWDESDVKLATETVVKDHAAPHP